MSGPALKQLNAHSSIHDTARGEAEELTAEFRRLVENALLREACETAGLIVEHWRTRTLRHATEEEAGLYREIVVAQPERVHDIGALTRDHDLMRALVAEAEFLLWSLYSGSRTAIEGAVTESVKPPADTADARKVAGAFTGRIGEVSYGDAPQGHPGAEPEEGSRGGAGEVEWNPPHDSPDTREVLREIAIRFEMLLWLVERHSREEEAWLLQP